MVRDTDFKEVPILKSPKALQTFQLIKCLCIEVEGIPDHEMNLVAFALKTALDSCESLSYLKITHK